MSHAPNHAIRKAAILVSSLDTAAADALLGEMPAEVAARVRHAVLELHTLDPYEQRQVLEEFQRASSGAADPAGDGVELDSALAHRLAANGGESSTYQLPPEREQPPFHFLHDTNAATLALQLAREHAQTIAVVLAHLRPAHAADVLGHLAAEQQAAVLDRLGDLDQADPEVLREIEVQLQTVLADHIKASQRRAAGRSTIAAILSAAAPHVRQQLTARIDRNPQPAAAAVRPAHAAPPTPQGLASAIERLNRATARPAAPVAAPAPPAHAALPPAPANPPVDISFNELEALDDHALGLVLQAAGPQLTLLALAGANSSLVNRLLRRLPAREAQAFRQRITSIGPVRVRDMEAAQTELAHIAAELAASERITLPGGRRLSLAA